MHEEKFVQSDISKQIKLEFEIGKWLMPQAKRYLMTDGSQTNLSWG